MNTLTIDRVNINALHETIQDTRAALRFVTCGSVDDGKSTLIGRLLVDSRAVLQDHLAGVQRGGETDLALLTDGLSAEREQGITIDVAYRYFSTESRKFIIADAPGHEQYTRNMVTAASSADAAVVLVDATKLEWQVPAPELLPQTRRHSLLVNLLRVPSIVFAINKLDAVTTPGAAFNAVRAALAAFAAEAGIEVAAIVPVSALRGDNVILPVTGAWQTWYDGPSLLQVLEALPAAEENQDGPLALPLQYIAKEGDGTGHQLRTLWGRIAQGRVQAGDTVQVFPSGEQARVVALRRAGNSVDSAEAGQSAGLVLDRQLDVSRGDWVAAPGTLAATQRFGATLAWLDTEPAAIGRKYWLRHGHRWVQGRIAAIEHVLDIHNLRPTDAHQLAVNEIARVIVQTQQPLPLQAYARNRIGGALIVVDPASHRTSGALLVEPQRA